MCQRENEIPDDVIKKNETRNIIVVLILIFVFYVGFMAGAFKIRLRDKYMSEYLDAYWDGNAYRLRNKKVNVVNLLRGE